MEDGDGGDEVRKNAVHVVLVVMVMMRWWMVMVVMVVMRWSRVHVVMVVVVW